MVYASRSLKSILICTACPNKNFSSNQYKNLYNLIGSNRKIRNLLGDFVIPFVECHISQVIITYKKISFLNRSCSFKSILKLEK